MIRLAEMQQRFIIPLNGWWIVDQGFWWRGFYRSSSWVNLIFIYYGSKFWQIVSRLFEKKVLSEKVVDRSSISVFGGNFGHSRNWVLSFIGKITLCHYEAITSAWLALFELPLYEVIVWSDFMPFGFSFQSPWWKMPGCQCTSWIRIWRVCYAGVISLMPRQSLNVFTLVSSWKIVNN
jgi:hypothetical protein